MVIFFLSSLVSLSLIGITACSAAGGNPLMGMEVIVLRYWLFCHMMFLIGSVLIRFTNLAGKNLPCPCCLILLVDFNKNLWRIAARPL